MENMGELFSSQSDVTAETSTFWAESEKTQSRS